MNNFIYRTIFSRIAFLILAVFFVSCQEEQELEVEPLKKVCKVLKAKHSENRSTNNRGDFEVVHYFLYDDGTLEEVSLRNYMNFNVSDTISWYE